MTKTKPAVPTVGEEFFTVDWWKKPNPFPPKDFVSYLKDADEVVEASQQILDHEDLTPNPDFKPDKITEIEVSFDDQELERMLQRLDEEPES